MLRSPPRATAFRVAFVILVAAAIVTLAWQCTGQPAGPSRIDWPAGSTAKP